MHDPLLFILATLAILVVPGPTNTLIATSGATAGFQRSLRLIGGEVTGYLTSIVLIGLFLKPLMVQNPLIFGVLRLLVGVYLLMLAVGLWRYKLSDNSTILPITLHQVFITTFINPKTAVFALVIVPFGEGDVWLYLAGFAGLVILVALAWVAVGEFFGTAADQKGYATLVPRFAAAAIGMFAITLVLGPYV